MAERHIQGMAVMDVTSSTSGLYTQYRSLIDGLRGRSSAVLPEDDTDAANEQLVQTRRDTAVQGHSGFSSPSAIETAAVQMDPSTQIQAQEAKSDKVGTIDPGRDLVHVGWPTMEAVRDDLNETAYGFLRDYAGSHQTEWRATADQMGINLGWSGYHDQFFNPPRTSGVDVGAGTPNSEAERIFRRTASPEDVAKFEAMMAPKTKEAQDKITEKVLYIMGTITTELNDFAPFVDEFAKAGVTPDDMRLISMKRSEDGRYVVEGKSDKAEAIEGLVNGIPELRALYDKDAAYWDDNMGGIKYPRPQDPAGITSPKSSDSGSIYGKYQGLIDKFSSGEIKASEALAEHRELFQVARGYGAFYSPPT